MVTHRSTSPWGTVFGAAICLWPALFFPFSTQAQEQAAASVAPVVVSGIVPDEATRQLVIERARDIYGPTRVVDQMGIGELKAPPNWSQHLAQWIGPHLKQVQNGQLRITGTVIEITGDVSSEAQKQAIGAQLSTGLNPTYTLRNDLTVKTINVATEQMELDAALANRVIEFGNGSAVLTPNGIAVLDGLYPVLQKFGDRTFEIVGHTDALGNRNLNLILSKARAESVRQYFIQKGMSYNRFSTLGMGPDKPVAANDTEANRARNRRIEFRVMPVTAPS